MRPLLVVRDEPALGQCADLRKRLEEIYIKDLRTIAAVEALDEGVLVWLAWLDVVDRNAPLLAPVDKSLGHELGTVVDPDRGGPAMQGDECLHNQDHPPGRSFEPGAVYLPVST